MEDKTLNLETAYEVRGLCEKAVRARLDEIKDLVNSAESCMAECDYFQAAVRIGELERLSKFTQIEFEVFDVASREVGHTHRV